MDNFIHWFLFTLIIKVVAVPSSVMCPYLPLWESRSEMFCEDNPSFYHCLTDQAGNLREACVKPVLISRGHYPVLSLDLDFIKPVKCPPTHYQPGELMSNKYKSITCMYPKSLCDDDGEEKCDDGSDVTDRMCRCDHTRGYTSLEYLINNPKNQSCYHPKSEEKGCVMYTCPQGKELNPAYICVKKCPEGYRRQKYEFGCVKINPLPSPKVQSTSTAKPPTTTVAHITKVHEDIDSMMKKTEEDNSPLVGAVVGTSIVAIFLVGLIVFLIVCLRRRGSHQPICGDHSTLAQNSSPNTELLTIPGSEDQHTAYTSIQAGTVIQNLHIHRAKNVAIGDDNRVTSITQEDLCE